MIELLPKTNEQDLIAAF